MWRRLPIKLGDGGSGGHQCWLWLPQIGHASVAKDGVIPQYHRAGLKKSEAIEATKHTTKTPIATRPTCLDIRSILACKTSASTEALSVVCSLACSIISRDPQFASMVLTGDTSKFLTIPPINESDQSFILSRSRNFRSTRIELSLAQIRKKRTRVRVYGTVGCWGVKTPLCLCCQRRMCHCM